jgi:hypothetical protein
MGIVRAVIIALVAISIAGLPVAGAKARIFLPGTSDLAAPSECCPQGQDCDKQAKGDCAKLAACALKCSSFSVSAVAPSGMVQSPSPLLRSIFVAENVRSPSTNPLLPPPRV